MTWGDHLDQLRFFIKSPVLLGRAVLPACGSGGSAACFVPVERHADVSDEATAGYLGSVPVGRMGRPEDVAHAVSLPPRKPAS